MALQRSAKLHSLVFSEYQCALYNEAREPEFEEENIMCFPQFLFLDALAQKGKAAISKMKRLEKNRIGLVFAYAIFLLQLTGTHITILAPFPQNGIVRTGASIALNKTQQQHQQRKQSKM